MTARNCIKRALRLVGAIDAGEEPEAAEAADALETLNDILRGLWGHGVGTVLTDKDAGQTIESGARYGVSFTTPANPEDGARIGASAAVTITANTGQTIGGAASVSASAGASWFYRADLRDWKAESALALGDALPFAEDVNGALAPLLAVAIAPEYGVGVSDALAVAADQARRRIGQRYASRIQTATDRGLLPTRSDLSDLF